MARSSLNIHLMVPGLLGPMPTLGPPDGVARRPILERLLSRGMARQQAGHDLESTLFALFGVTVDADRNLPTAIYRRIGDGGAADDRYWLQLTPIYLRPDQDRLLLFDAEDLGLTLDEAAGLARLFNRHFSEEGWQVEMLDPHRWYLPLSSSPDLKTYELADVFGRNMDLFLPEGEAGIHWHGVLNEIQMLFYTADINTRREAEGKGLISGLWLSGGGKLVTHLQTDLTAIWADVPLLRGLAKTRGIPIDTLPDEAAIPLPQQGEVLICYDRLLRHVLCADPYGWSEQLDGFESWIGPLIGAIQDGRLHTLTLYPCNGTVYQITRGALRRFWKRNRSFRERLDRNPVG